MYFNHHIYSFQFNSFPFPVFKFILYLFNNFIKVPLLSCLPQVLLFTAFMIRLFLFYFFILCSQSSLISLHKIFIFLFFMFFEAGSCIFTFPFFLIYLSHSPDLISCSNILFTLSSFLRIKCKKLCFSSGLSQDNACCN